MSRHTSNFASILRSLFCSVDLKNHMQALEPSEMSNTTDPGKIQKKAKRTKNMREHEFVQIRNRQQQHIVRRLSDPFLYFPSPTVNLSIHAHTLVHLTAYTCTLTCPLAEHGGSSRRLQGFPKKGPTGSTKKKASGGLWTSQPLFTAKA